MNTKVELTKEFLLGKFDECEYYKLHEDEKNYRIEHTFRVANIGRKIAEQEGFDVEGFIIGCLLHDVSYCTVFTGEDDQKNHGRTAAKIARPFLEKLGLEKRLLEDICYGIAIHVDDVADFEGEETPFALSIGDADNIDRFDVYRIYENLQRMQFDKLPLDQKMEAVTTKLKRLEHNKNTEMATETANQMWQSRIAYQAEFFTNLKAQRDASRL